MAGYLISTIVTAIIGGAAGAFFVDADHIAMKALQPAPTWTELAVVQADADGGHLDCLKDDKAEWQRFVFSGFAQRPLALRDEALRAGLDQEAAKRVADTYSERLADEPGACDPAKADQNEAKAMGLRRVLSGSSVEG